MNLLGIDPHRLKTRVSALRRLYALDQTEIDAFMNAYLLFDGDWSNQNGKREEQIIDYYNVLNLLCALGNVEKMYFPPYLDPSVGVAANQVLFERKMMRDIGAGPESRVLDIGCGRGRVACHTATQTGARVSGINIDPSQIASARRFAARTGLGDRADFGQGSLNDPLSFADETFDAVYQIQAFSYAKDLVAVFSEVFRVLRPGGRFSYLDWVLLPAYDETNPEHVALVDRARGLLGAVESPYLQEVIGALQKAGFRIVLSDNPSINGQQHQLISAEDRYFHYVRRAIDIGVSCRLMPRYFRPLLARLMQDADALITIDEMGIATTAYHIVAERPD